ncbi:MAG: hypothetical protein ACI8VT_002965 [Saprospiraceae bacterium]|jgi:hypothetical protein
MKKPLNNLLKKPQNLQQNFDYLTYSKTQRSFKFTLSERSESKG